MKLTLFVLLSLFAVSFAQAQMTNRGDIESPSAFVSGIGFIAGWKCNTNDIELWLTGSAREGVLKLNPAQNMPRSDTAGVCLGEENNGWIIQVNWNELIGYDRVVARDNGEAFDSRSFTIGHTGLPFINDKGGTEVEVVDFPAPGTATTLTWSTATQHFEVAGTENIAPCTGDACAGSGEGAVSRAGNGEGGIICEPAFNSEERTHGRTLTCEYRESLQSLPGGAVNWLLDDDGCIKYNSTPFYYSSGKFRLSGLYHRFATATRDDHWYSAIDDELDSDANWYSVRYWRLFYNDYDGRWGVIPGSYRDGFIVPVPDDEPGYWNQHKYYSKEIPFDDQASYHLRQISGGKVRWGAGQERADYIQYQFYALGPASSLSPPIGPRSLPCFRDIPQVPAP